MKMKKVHVLAIICSMVLAAGSAHGAPAHIGTQLFTSGQGATSFNVTYTGALNGSLLVAVVKTSDPGSTSLTSTWGTWTKDAYRNIYDRFGEVAIFSAPNVSSGDKTFTIHCTTSNVLRVVVLEYSGMATTNVAHKTATGAGTNSAVATSSVTTTLDNCILVVGVGTDGDGDSNNPCKWSAGTNYAMRDNPCNMDEPEQKLGVEDRSPVAQGTYSGNMAALTDSWAAVLVAYAPNGSNIASIGAPQNMRIIP